MLPTRPTVGDASWFTHDRFGLFIHWGLYALAARHEWVMAREGLSAEEYRARYLPRFDPDLYDPALWAKAAADAGMKYFAVTTKHHEGFCLWDSALTDFTAVNSPAKRDLLKPMVEAFRAQGMRVGLYHSLIDWSHPHFVIDRFHPLKKHPDWQTLNAQRDQRKYADYLHGQVRELLDGRYGPIDMLWLDFSYKPAEDATGAEALGKGRDDWRSEELLALVRKLQPQILVNDRLDLLDSPTAWDFKTPEQWQPPRWFHLDGRPVVWEVCHTFSGSWGYHRDEQSWKPAEMLIQLLIDSVSKGGNLILNVGPTARGEFDARALDRLAGIGKWMKRHGRSIYGCTQPPADLSPQTIPPDTRLTYNPVTRRLYVHLFTYPFGQLYLPGLGQKVAYAQFVHDASEVRFNARVPDSILEGRRGATGDPSLLILDLPALKPDSAVPVIELFLKE